MLTREAIKTVQKVYVLGVQEIGASLFIRAAARGRERERKQRHLSLPRARILVFLLLLLLQPLEPNSTTFITYSYLL